MRACVRMCDRVLLSPVCVRACVHFIENKSSSSTGSVNYGRCHSEEYNNDNTFHSFCHFY